MTHYPSTTNVQAELFPPHSGTQTSWEAAESMKPTASTLREKVYRFAVRQGEYGATRDEMQAYLGMDGNTLRPRVWELMKEGRLGVTPLRRKTPTGRNAEVLVALL